MEKGAGTGGGRAGDRQAEPQVSGFKMRLKLRLEQMTGAEFMSWDLLLNKPQTYTHSFITGRVSAPHAICHGIEL